MLKIKFSYFPVINSPLIWVCLSWRLFSIFQNFENSLELYWIIPTIVTKQVEMISCLFTTSPDGRTAGLLEESKLSLTQPSLAATWAELGKKIVMCLITSMIFPWIKQTMSGIPLRVNGLNNESKAEIFHLKYSSSRLIVTVQIRSGVNEHIVSSFCYFGCCKYWIVEKYIFFQI